MRPSVCRVLRGDARRHQPFVTTVVGAASVSLVLAAAGCGGSEDDVTATLHAWGDALRDRDAARVCELMAGRRNRAADCEADVRNSTEFGWTVRLEVRSVSVSGNTARAVVRVVDPGQPESSTLRTRTEPFGLRRRDGRWRVVIASR